MHCVYIRLPAVGWTLNRGQSLRVGMTGSQDHTRPICRTCGTVLAIDNHKSEKCSPCMRTQPDGGPPHLSADFWEAPDLQEAFRTRQFGAFLRAYREAQLPTISQTQLGQWLGLTQAQISRLERGVTPAQDLIKLDRWAQALRIPQRYLWFTLAHDSLLASSNPHLGVQPDSADLGKEAGGIRRRESLKAATSTSVAIVGASLLTSSSAPHTATSPETAGDAEVQMVQEMTQTFRRLDNRHGGGHGHMQATVHAYLHSVVEPLLKNKRSTAKIGTHLFTATADLYQLAGWMAYDTGHTGSGRQYLRDALRLANEAHNHAFAAEILAGMSHQAAFHGATGAALDLALAARQTSKREGLSILNAEAAVMEAHALALRGNRQESVRALHDAELSFAAGDHEQRPEWLAYFDEAYLAAKFAHTFLAMGQPREAEVFARRSLEMSAGYERGRLFNTALLASTLAAQRQVEEACETAASALAMTKTVRSTRTMGYLADVHTRLRPFEPHAAVTALSESMLAIEARRGVSKSTQRKR
jgi:transcriptional regulator with XRE-family HTH domain